MYKKKCSNEEPTAPGPRHQSPVGRPNCPHADIWKNDPNQPFHQPATQMLLNLYYSGCNQSSCDGDGKFPQSIKHKHWSCHPSRCWLQRHLNERNQRAFCKWPFRLFSVKGWLSTTCCGTCDGNVCSCWPGKVSCYIRGRKKCKIKSYLQKVMLFAVIQKGAGSSKL